jgi:hypothetical protein
METVTFRLERKQIAWLKKQAKVLGRSQASILRDLVDEYLKRPTLHDLAKDFCGSVRGPRDLSARPLTGYGRDSNR